jgi:hypothetical protein
MLIAKGLRSFASGISDVGTNRSGSNQKVTLDFYSREPTMVAVLHRNIAGSNRRASMFYSDNSAARVTAL